MFQFPYPVPDMPPPPLAPVELLIACIVSVLIVVLTTAMLLPPPWFVWLFRIAFPFMPEKLENWDKKR